MNYSAFLSRRLSQEGCIVAGTQIRAQRAQLKEDQVKLLPKTDAASAAVVAQTELLEQLPSTDATMTILDRVTDRCVAGINDELDAVERCLDGGDIVPLSKKQEARRKDASLVRTTILPSGTGMLRLPYGQQWVRMSTMVKAMKQEEIQAAITRLGLTEEAARVEQLVALYGAKLGITEKKDADPSAMALDAWHEAYGQLVVHAHSEYDNKNAALLEVRDALIAPYETQAEEERRAEQKARDKRKPSDPEASKTP